MDHNGHTFPVGVAEWKLTESPHALRTTLGSCTGIVLYAPEQKMGGIAHILLGDPPPGRIIHRGKYARTALEGLLADFQKQGIAPSSLRARLYGGASLFEVENSSFFNKIGPGNVEAARQALQSAGLRIIHEDTGGNVGRTITLFTDDGRLLLRAGSKEQFIYKVN